MVKRASSRKRERTDSISSTKSSLTYATSPEVSPTGQDAIGGAGKQVGGRLPENFTLGDIWRLDGQDGSRGVSRGRRWIPPPVRVRSTAVLGTINSSIGGKNRTRLQTCRQWKLPMLILDLVSTLGWNTLSIPSSQFGE